MKKLKYCDYDVVFQEVPNEISLAINVTGCPHACEGCHSDYLWEYFGRDINDDIDNILNRYKDFITCVCFMGGDQNLENLKELLQMIKQDYHLKTCLYTGLNETDSLVDIIPFLDYLKTGAYIQEKGGLSNPSTNQTFYKITNNEMINITSLFQKE